MGQGSGWLVAAYTEFVAQVVSFLLFEDYECTRIWEMSPDLCD